MVQSSCYCNFIEESIFMKILLVFSFLVLPFTYLSAQVRDTAHLPKKSLETSMFADDDTLTRNDYLLSLEKVFQLLNRASSLSQNLPPILVMIQRMDEDDSA